MAHALRAARMNPEDVDVIFAHGTSTPLNDATETQAIKAVFGDHAYRLAISATKSMVGHLIGAAGALSALAGVLTFRDGIVPPTINQEAPDPACDLDYVPNVARHKPAQAVMVNVFSFGGRTSSCCWVLSRTASEVQKTAQGCHLPLGLPHYDVTSLVNDCRVISKFSCQVGCAEIEVPAFRLVSPRGYCASGSRDDRGHIGDLSAGSSPSILRPVASPSPHDREDATDQEANYTADNTIRDFPERIQPRKLGKITSPFPYISVFVKNINSNFRSIAACKAVPDAVDDLAGRTGEWKWNIDVGARPVAAQLWQIRCFQTASPFYICWQTGVDLTLRRFDEESIQVPSLASRGGPETEKRCDLLRRSRVSSPRLKNAVIARPCVKPTAKRAQERHQDNGCKVKQYSPTTVSLVHIAPSLF